MDILNVHYFNFALFLRYMFAVLLQQALELSKTCHDCICHALRTVYVRLSECMFVFMPCILFGIHLSFLIESSVKPFNSSPELTEIMDEWMVELFELPPDFTIVTFSLSMKHVDINVRGFFPRKRGDVYPLAE